MFSTIPATPTLNSSRLRSLVWPREHGAWGILLVPLVTGAWVGHPTGERIVWLVLFAAVALGLFCLRTPVEAWLKISPLRPQNPTERRAIVYSVFVYATVAGTALTILLWQARAYGLLLLGTAAATAFLGQAILKGLGRATRTNAQLTGSLALTSTAAGAYYIACGRLDGTALVVWTANWLFAANQIHYVQLRIRSARAFTPAEKLARGQTFLAGETMTGAFLAFAWRFGWLPGPVLLAFAPALFRGVWWFFQRACPLEIHRLGLSELVHALVFGVLLIVGFYIHPH